MQDRSNISEEKIVVDIIENKIDPTILDILLKDRTTGRNIIWATDNYASKGDGYGFFDEIKIDTITGSENGLVICPRIKKSKEEQETRSKNKAEVFTAAWICNKQINLIDSAWFGYSSPFNKETEYGWETIYDKISFPQGRKWQDYVIDTRLEMACGEGPYLVSRFDVTSGTKIPVKDRVGILDRKFRIISENTPDERSDYNIEKWRLNALRALSSTYGFEWQGDSLLLAREAILETYIEFYEEKWGQRPNTQALKKVAEIISWNIWQMDGLKLGIPGYIPKEQLEGMFIGDDINPYEKYCRILEWESIKPLSGKEIPFITLINK